MYEMNEWGELMRCNDMKEWVEWMRLMNEINEWDEIKDEWMKCMNEWMKQMDEMSGWIIGWSEEAKGMKMYKKGWKIDDISVMWWNSPLWW